MGPPEKPLTYEEEILAKHSTPRLRRNILPRQAKKLNMEFYANYNKMTKKERDDFLDAMYGEDNERSTLSPSVGEVSGCSCG